PVLPVLRRPAQIEPGAEIVAEAEDDHAFRLLAGALNNGAQLFHDVGDEAIALVGTVETDESDLVFRIVGDSNILDLALLRIQPTMSHEFRRVGNRALLGLTACAKSHAAVAHAVRAVPSDFAHPTRVTHRGKSSPRCAMMVR